MENEWWVLYADTYGVFEYVLQTKRYREIFGASALLDVLNRVVIPQRLKEIPDAKLVSVGGGELRALFVSEQDAQDFGTVMESLYQQWTMGAVRLVFGYAQRQPKESLAATFLRAQLVLRHKEVEEIPEAGTLSLLPFVSACESCGNHPASRETMHRLLCEVCAKKWRFGKVMADRAKGTVGNWSQEEQEINTQLGEWMSESGNASGLLDVYQRVLSMSDDELDGQVGDMQALGEASLEGSRIAFLYADGNQMGKFFSQINEVKSFDQDSMSEDQRYISTLNWASTQIHQQTVSAIVDTIKEFVEIPILVAMAGGDDVVVMIPAHVAIPFAIKLAETYEAKMKTVVDQLNSHAVLSLAVGIVIARSGYPLHHLFSLGYETMHETKKLAGEIDGSAFSWVILGSNDPPQLNRQVLKFPHHAEAVSHHLYAGPFSIAQIRGIQEAAKKMNEIAFPRGKMKSFFRLLQLPPIEGEYQWRQWRMHLKPEQDQVIINLLLTWGARSLSKTPWIPMDEPHDFMCPIGDLFEIYHYTGVNRNGGVAHEFDVSTKN